MNQIDPICAFPTNFDVLASWQLFTIKILIDAIQSSLFFCLGFFL